MDRINGRHLSNMFCAVVGAVLSRDGIQGYDCVLYRAGIFWFVFLYEADELLDEGIYAELHRGLDSSRMGVNPLPIFFIQVYYKPESMPQRNNHDEQIQTPAEEEVPGGLS